MLDRESDKFRKQNHDKRDLQRMLGKKSDHIQPLREIAIAEDI